METPTGIYDFEVEPEDVVEIGLLEVDVDDKNSEVSLRVDAHRIGDLTVGKWKSCLIGRGRYIACTETVFDDLETINRFESMLSKKYVVSSEEEARQIASRISELKREYDISDEILGSLNVVLIKDDVDSPVVELEVTKKDKVTVSSEKIKVIEDILSDSDFAPRMSEFKKGNFIYNIEWKKSVVFALANSFSVCGFVIQEINETDDEEERSFYDS